VYSSEVIPEFIESSGKIRGICRVIRVAIRRLYTDQDEYTNVVAMIHREPEYKRLKSREIQQGMGMMGVMK